MTYASHLYADWCRDLLLHVVLLLV